MDIIAFVMLIIIGLVGAVLVIAGALTLRRFFLNGPRRLSAQLVISHSLIVLVIMVLGWAGIFIPSIPYDDVDIGYFFVPGILLYWVGEQLSLTSHAF